MCTEAVSILYYHHPTHVCLAYVKVTHAEKTTQHNARPKRTFLKKKPHSGWTRTHASCILGVMFHQMNY